MHPLRRICTYLHQAREAMPCWDRCICTHLSACTRLSMHGGCARGEGGRGWCARKREVVVSKLFPGESSNHREPGFEYLSSSTGRQHRAPNQAHFTRSGGSSHAFACHL